MLPAVLRTNPDFRKAFLGDLMSSLGTAVSVIAFPLLALSIGGSAVEAGSIGTVSLGTQLGFRLPAGYFADRWNRRTLMVATDMVRLAALGSIPVVALLGRLLFAQLIVVAAVEGLASALFKPAGDVLIKDVVSEDDLAGALGLGQSVLASTYLVGPAVGGIMFAMDHVLPFTIDAASYGVSAVLLLSMTSRPPRPLSREASSGGMMAGARWLLRQRTLSSILAYASVLNFVAAVLEVMVILEMHSRGLSGGQIGLILACCGVGAVTGSLLSSHLVKRLSMPVILMGIGVVWSLVLLEFAIYVSPWLTAALLTVLMTLSPAAGVTVGHALISGTPRELLGRVNAVTGVMLSGLTALGPFAAGALFQAIGAAGSWLAMVALTLAATALSWLSLRTGHSVLSTSDNARKLNLPAAYPLES